LDYGFNYDTVMGMINKIGIAYTLPNSFKQSNERQ